MTKGLVIALLIASLVGFIWAIAAHGTDGSLAVAIVPLVIVAVIAGISKVRTGSWTSDSSGGH